ncbi:symmetrical bis(5'-nucleosyl)-tetraphosphatase [Salinisphaera sp. T31B1]|uniref:symmetrical bis(5'-nucleosyl)-tetraphosphatase n=1 Tax=Salinisphaera sp. T31B1 TaxID=727963 RepID=UPI00334287D9
MRTYAIGDIHGAEKPLVRLLKRLEANTSDVRFWFVGDLVNRGPASADVLRRVRSLGNQATVVLGNHDLSLLALAQRPDALDKANGSLKALLCAPDRDELLDWLRHRPLIHRDESLGWTMVHAGIPAEWDMQDAVRHAHELEAALRGSEHREFLAQLFGNTPERWHPSLSGIERLRYIANALTRQRFVQPDGGLDMAYKKTLAAAPAQLTPWFAARPRATAGERIVFGHWSALEHVAWPEHHVWGIDTGAAWGGTLTALRLDGANPELVQVDA